MFPWYRSPAQFVKTYIRRYTPTNSDATELVASPRTSRSADFRWTYITTYRPSCTRPARGRSRVHQTTFARCRAFRRLFLALFLGNLGLFFSS